MSPPERQLFTDILETPSHVASSAQSAPVSERISSRATRSVGADSVVGLADDALRPTNRTAPPVPPITSNALVKNSGRRADEALFSSANVRTRHLCTPGPEVSSGRSARMLFLTTASSLAVR